MSKESKLAVLAKMWVNAYGAPLPSGMSADEAEARLAERAAAMSETPVEAKPPSTPGVSQEPPNADVAVARPVRDLQQYLGRVPNLSPIGRWEGRSRRVTLHKRDETSNSEAVQVGWEGVIWSIKYDTVVDMPWPYWQSLQNTDFVDDRSETVTEWKQDADKKIYAVRTPRKMPTVRFTDHGDTPGTHDKPECYAQYFRERALATQCFAGHSRAALIAVHNYLFDRHAAAFFRDLSDEDIRIAIADRLGPDVSEIVMGHVFNTA